MSKASRRARRAQQKAADRGGGFGPCDAPKCERKAVGELHCITCEKLIAAGKRKPEDAHRVAACRQHAEWAHATIRKQALVKHPVNIVRAIAASLKGEL